MIINPHPYKGKLHHSAKHIELYENGIFVKEFGTLSECAVFVGCAASTINKCIMHDKPFHQYTFKEGGK